MIYYREFAKKHVKEERKREREEIVKAWNILDPKGAGTLRTDDPKLINVLRRIKPGVSEWYMVG